MTTPFPFVAGAVLTAQQLNDITNLSINDQTANYVLVVGDAGKRVIMNNAGATTITVNNSVFTTGDTIFIANKGAGACTITAGAGVTINSASGLVVTQYQSGQLIALSASSFLFVESDVTVTSGVIQVKSTIKTDSFSTTSTTFVDVTGVSVSITPTSASNKVLVLVSGVNGSNGVDNFTPINLVRDSTAIAQSTGNANFAATLNLINQSTGITLPFSIVFLDSPATTSATTYKLQMRSNNNPLAYIGRQATSDNRSVTTITAMEVAP